MHTRRQICQALGFSVANAVAGSRAFSQASFPARPMQAVIGFPPGNGADIMCRYFATKAQEAAGHAIVILNKPGAFTSIAYATVASARPDGYTMLMAGNSLMANGDVFVKNLPFKRSSFVPAASFAETPFMVVVSAKSPAGSVKELVALLKNKKRSRYGHTNPANFVFSAYLKHLEGFEAEGVVYKAASDALADVDNGTLDFMLFDGTFAIGHIKSGRLRVLAVTSSYRLKTLLPDVPTMIELGYSDFDLNPWWGVYFPAGTPKDIVEKAGAWFEAVTRAPETAAYLEPLVLVPLTHSTEKMAARLDKDGQSWTRLAKIAGLEAQ